MPLHTDTPSVPPHRRVRDLCLPLLPNYGSRGCKSTSYEHHFFSHGGKADHQVGPPCSSPAPSCLSSSPPSGPGCRTSVLQSWPVPFPSLHDVAFPQAARLSGRGQGLRGRTDQEKRGKLYCGRRLCFEDGSRRGQREGTSRGERCAVARPSPTPLHICSPLLHVPSFCFPTDASPPGTHAPKMIDGDALPKLGTLWFLP